jgi:hypothetical protein
MSAFPSSYARDKINDKIYKNTNFTSPAALYISLHTEDPLIDGSGDEVTGGSYARQSVTFANSASGTSSSNIDVDFTDLPTASITHYGLWDAVSGGNLWVFGALPNTIASNSGDDVTIASGDIDFTLSGS